ncbi:MAG: M1 family metallopeptidase [Bacteroidia bacterium]|nr:M1 family metallopeptidase [Bacteroidia bacterium]NNJ55906.1 M1 family metallopeptidase [Bacteroidia bacterium]
MRIGIVYFIIILITLVGCNNNTSQTNSVPVELSKDAHSYANINEVRIEHMSLDLSADFEKKILEGKVRLDINNWTGSNKLVLDSRKLSINEIILNNGKQASFELGEDKEPFGQPLTIAIEQNTKSVTIDYATSSNSDALQWLNPSQTFGKEHPFLFSQSQAILARTWIPCQDGPGVKFTYDATIKTDPNLMVLMSAKNGTKKNSEGVYTFEMDQPVSSYLMAITIGDLEFQSTGRNSGVYAEPAMLSKSVWELESMQSMIDSAEALYGEYAWGQYDVVILPPSFPFGGMENPRLTFATPTIISGDRSLVSLIAHELAHSWSGNLVTNETWNDFWLNEGFTVYFEQRIMEKVYGSEYEKMLTKLGMGDLEHTIKKLNKKGKPEETHLYLNLDGRDPDDGLTDVAYEKGRFFLQTVEATVGRERFDKFLKQYFTTNAFKPMNTKRFIGYLKDNLLQDPEELKKVRIDEWVYGPGIPSNVPEIYSQELDRVELAISQFNNKRKTASELNTANYTTHHWLYFLRGLKNLELYKMNDLDNTFNFTKTGNSEIACDWFKHCIDTDYKEAFPALEVFLISVGRRKFLQPLYEKLAETEENRDWAKAVYEKARPGYHSVSYNTIDEILK